MNAAQNGIHIHRHRPTHTQNAAVEFLSNVIIIFLKPYVTLNTQAYLRNVKIIGFFPFGVVLYMVDLSHLNRIRNESQIYARPWLNEAISITFEFGIYVIRVRLFDHYVYRIVLQQF